MISLYLPPTLIRRRVTVAVDGEEYTVSGEWNPAALTHSRGFPADPAGFENPTIFRQGEDIGITLSLSQYCKIITKAEEEIIYG